MGRTPRYLAFRMFRVTEEVRFCYGHRLLDYEGPCARIHGHNARVEIELSAPTLDRKGFVADFFDIEKAGKDWILAQFDHRLILREDDPVIPFLKQAGEAFVTLPVNPSAENFAKLIFDHLRGHGVPVTAVSFYETDTAVATYDER
ncbi:6-pyruvoyl trahydropterin synthase family protein [Polyangium sorediatum]|uniref:6-carboxy-5,6,7,8-tetrahydropterin synthase n=1 Tax=Polyangium sorediatum TaxID=889274 RepID=A0ABT6P0Z2_9BACT|nr:6-carboxytetrahydropterin synthase [Polyangium sorediatum]MDI1434269.1 6-carboxytetrahydropterin synthase [Polyangium sorediatum]